MFVISKDAGKGHRQTTGEPVKAFTQNKIFEFSKVHGVLFRPKEPEWRIIRDYDDKDKFNTYLAPEISPKEGDIGWFHDFMRRICPREEDREIITTYCVSLIQNPGAKFQWCLGLQGAQGIGKSALSDLLELMIGEKYVYRLRGGLKSTKDFNSWMYQRLLIEISEFTEKNATTHFRALRDYITGRRVDVELKGHDSVMRDNLANFIITTNEKGAFAQLWKERRLAPISLGAQSEYQKKEAGLTSEYWTNFYARLRRINKKPPLAIRNLFYWMSKAPVNPLYDPLGKECRGQAPKTTFIEEAKEISRSALADRLLKVIEKGEFKGLKGGVMFSTAMSRAVGQPLGARQKMTISEELGYVSHSLFPGRFTAPVKEEEGQRPTVYIKEGHRLLKVKDKRNFQRQCLTLQGYGWR